MITTRLLAQDEVTRIWEIDRSEVIERIYYYENGSLVLKDEHYDMKGWPPGEGEKYTPILLECLEQGGWLQAAFDGSKLVGVAILEGRFIGRDGDTLQLKFLHVSSNYRKQGLGRELFEAARAKARERGARRIYISATPSENTVNFYLGLGCSLASEPDPELFALEPEDIHLECEV